MVLVPTSLTVHINSQKLLKKKAFLSIYNYPKTQFYKCPVHPPLTIGLPADCMAALEDSGVPITGLACLSLSAASIA